MNNSDIDLNFKLAADSLSKSNIFFWIGQGSLLGIIREKKLIEWDHDIDICVWHEHNEKKKIIKILKKKGFMFRSDLEFGRNFDQISFDKKGGRRVDINFYKKGTSKDGEKIAFVTWGYPRNKFMKIIDAISQANTYNSRYKWLVQKLIFLKSISTFFKVLFIKHNLFYCKAGYKQPLKFLKKFKKIIFYKTTVYIPKYSEEYLEYIYGDNWKKPNKNFSWWKLQNLNYDNK